MVNPYHGNRASAGGILIFQLVGKYLGCMLFCIYFVDFFHHDPFLIDEKSCAGCAPKFLTVSLFFYPYTIFFVNRGVSVCNEGKGKAILSLKILVGKLIVCTDTNNGISCIG